MAGRRADDKNILKQKSLIGFVPDFFGVYENLNVIEYLEFFAASYGIYGRAGTVRAREVLEMVELSGKRSRWWIRSQGAYSSGSVWRAR